jgi:hypothetical protein
MTIKTQIATISDKLAQLKLTLNRYSDNLSIEQYDCMYGDIEKLQYLVLELSDSIKEPSLDGGLGVDWVRVC